MIMGLRKWSLIILTEKCKKKFNFEKIDFEKQSFVCRFIKSVLNVTKSFNLDGLDLDWEFPVWAGSSKSKPERQKVNFIQLTYELRKEFDHSGQNLTLSAAVAALQAIIDESYYVPELSS